MSKTITRKYIQRITRREGDTSIRRNGSGGGGGGGVSQYWVDDNYVSKEFFNRLFEIHDENGDPILPNDVETEIDNIQAMFGFWTNAYLSALGQNEGGGGAELTLASLADVAVQGVTDGQALVWNAAQGKWVPGEGGGGLDPTAMWAELATTGTQQINKTHLTTALADYLPLAGGTMTNTTLVTNMNADLLDGHHAADFALASAISDMATQTWVGNNYLPLSGGIVSGLLTLSPSQATGSQDGLVLHDNGGGTNEGLRIRWTSASYSTGVYLTGHPDTGLLDINGETVATRTWVGQNYISIAFFNRLFKAYNNNTEVSANDSTSTIDNIKAMFGFWTNSYLSALGNNPGGASLTLSSLSDVSISGATAGQVLTYRNGTWRNETPQGGGGSVTSIVTGGTTYSPTNGVVTLPDYIVYTNENQSYLNASFLKTEYSQKAAQEYIEFWDSTGGWFNFKLGTLYAVSDVKVGNNSVIHAGNIGSQSVNYATSASKLETARTIWGQSFDGTANVSGDMTGVGTISASGDNTITKSSTDDAKFAANNNNGTIELLASDNRGIYDRTQSRWLIATNGTNSWLPAGNVGIGTTSPSYKLHVEGTGYYSSNLLVQSIDIGHGNEINATGSSNLLLQYRNSGDLVLCLNGANCGVGYFNPSYKLHVNGTFYASGNSSIGGTLGVTGATTLSSTLGVTGLITASGGITIPSGKTLTIGDAVLSWDSTNQGIKITKGLYSETFISALGIGSGSSMEVVWTALGNATNEQINVSHLTTALSGYNPTNNFKTINGNSIIGTGNIEVQGGGSGDYLPLSGGTVNGILTIAPTNTGGNQDGIVLHDSGLGLYESLRIRFTSNSYTTGVCLSANSDKTELMVNDTNIIYHTGNLTKVSQLTNDSGYITGSGSCNYANSAGSATKLQTECTIWGQSFDGTGNVSGSLTGVENITSSSYYLRDSSSNPYLNLKIGSQNWYVQSYSDGIYIGSTSSKSLKVDASGNVTVSGATTLSSTLGVTGNTTLSGTLSVSKATTLSSTLGVTGATTLSSTLSVSGTSTLTGHVGIGTSPHSTYVLRANGEVYVSTGLYSHGYVTALSDIRHKDILGDVGLTVSEVANAPAVKFLWKDRRQEGLQVGSIAQYWQKVLPEAIVEAADGELTMSYGVIALLASIVNAREIVNLKREIAELKRKLQKHGILE